MIVHGAQRLYTGAAGGGGIVGKPTAPFSPNTNYAHFPTLSALYFTDLIAGQTPYVEDSVAGRGDFVQSGGAFGAFSEGEGYEVNVLDASTGGQNDATVVGTGSFASVIEFTMTKAHPNYTYLLGYSTSYGNSFGPKNADCADEGVWYFANADYCLGDIGDGAIHRIALKMSRIADAAALSIALDGVMIHDAIPTDYYRSTKPLYIGKNQYGRNQRLWCSGAWEWKTPYGVDPLPSAALLELSADPWPYLAVLD